MFLWSIWHVQQAMVAGTITCTPRYFGNQVRGGCNLFGFHFFLANGGANACTESSAGCSASSSVSNDTPLQTPVQRFSFLLERKVIRWSGMMADELIVNPGAECMDNSSG